MTKFISHFYKNSFLFGISLRVISGFFSNFIIIYFLDSSLMAKFFYSITTFTFILSFIDFCFNQLITKFFKKNHKVRYLDVALLLQVIIFFTSSLVLYSFKVMDLSFIVFYVALISSQQIFDHYVRIFNRCRLYNFLSVFLLLEPLLRYFSFAILEVDMYQLSYLICIIPLCTLMFSMYSCIGLKNLKIALSRASIKRFKYYSLFSFRFYLNNSFALMCDYIIRTFIMRIDPNLLGHIYTIEKLMSVTQRFRTTSKLLWIRVALENFINSQRKSQLKLFFIISSSMVLFSSINIFFVYSFQSHNIPITYFFIFGLLELTWIAYYFISIGLPFSSRSKYVYIVTGASKTIEFCVLFLGYYYLDIGGVILFFYSKIVGVVVQMIGTFYLMLSSFKRRVEQ